MLNEKMKERQTAVFSALVSKFGEDQRIKSITKKDEEYASGKGVYDISVETITGNTIPIRFMSIDNACDEYHLKVGECGNYKFLIRTFKIKYDPKGTTQTERWSFNKKRLWDTISLYVDILIADSVIRSADQKRMSQLDSVIDTFNERMEALGYTANRFSTNSAVTTIETPNKLKWRVTINSKGVPSIIDITTPEDLVVNEVMLIKLIALVDATFQQRYMHLVR